MAVSFAPLGGEAFCTAVPPETRSGLPDSLVLLADDGRVLTRSAAVLHLARRLGGLWRMLAAIAGLLPVHLLDEAYDLVARVRTRLFPPPAEACPLLPKGLRVRLRA